MTRELTIQGATTILSPSTALPLVSVTIGIRSGASVDPLGQEGRFRFMLKAMRRGAEGYSAEEIDNRLDLLGAELEVEVYASHTILTAQVLSRNLDALMELLTRIIVQPTFPEAELSLLQREAIADLIETRDDDRNLAQIAFRKGLFGDHVYGRRIVGWIKSLSALDMKSVRELHRQSFVRENVILGFAGDIDDARAEAAAASLLKALPSGTPPVTDIPHPIQKPGRHLFFVDKPERTQHQLCVGRLGSWSHDEDHMDVTVGVVAFGGTFTAPLMREIRVKRGWSYGASARLAIAKMRHGFTMWTAPATEVGPDCAALNISLLKDLTEKGFKDKDIAFVRNYMARSHAFEIDTPQKRLNHALEVHLLHLPKDYYTGYIDALKTVTAEKASAAVAKRLGASDLVIAAVGTKDEHLAALEKAIPDLASTTVVPFDADG